MKFTYKTYLLNREMEKYSKSIEIIEKEQMDLGAIVTFHCEDKAIIEEIFSEE